MSLTPTPEQVDRMVDRIHLQPNGCWSWPGQHSKGYGRYDVRAPEQQTIAVHRFVWLWLRGPIPDDLHLDHLCRDRGCCNPDHLEIVTAAENLRRSDVALGIRSSATHCVNGHEFTAENTYTRTSGRRACRECKRAYDRRVYYDDIETARRKGREKFYRAKERQA